MTEMKLKDVQNKEATMIVTNDAVLFLREAVAMYIQHDFGDKDDPKLQRIKRQVDQDLHDAWKALNPS